MKKMGINTTSFEIFKETPLYLYSHSYYVSANESGTLKTLKTLKTYDFNESINLPDIKDNENLALQDENNLYNFLSGEDKEMQNNIEIEQNSQLLEKYTDIETVKMNGMNVSPNSGLYDSRNNIAEFIKVARIRNEEGEAQRILDETLKALKDYIVRNFEYVDSDNYDVGYYGERSRKKNFYRSDVNAFASANYEKALEFKMFDVARALTPLRNYITYNDKVRGDNWGSMSYEDGQKLIMRIFKK
jgi:hypothetical protein